MTEPRPLHRGIRKLVGLPAKAGLGGYGASAVSLCPRQGGVRFVALSLLCAQIVPWGEVGFINLFGLLSELLVLSQ
ncbi:MAG: hypothetical protein ACRDRL_00760 [Sciscionella sp.]